MADAMDDLLSAIEQDPLTHEERGETFAMLQKVLSNISGKPAELKFRTLKKDNKLIADKLCRSPGAVTLLLALGFEDEGAVYRLPDQAPTDVLAETAELIECILATRDGPARPVAPAIAPLPAAAASAAPPASGAKGGILFARKEDGEKQRTAAENQLEAIRAAQRAQFTEGGGSAAALRDAEPTAASPPSPSLPSAPTDKKVTPKSAFDFESRQKREAKVSNAQLSLEELRRVQRDKFKEHANDPNAKNSEAYKQPPSVSAGGKVEQGWGEWAGSFFGGSSSGGSSSTPASNGDRPRPKMKTINDLPKPVQRG